MKPAHSCTCVCVAVKIKINVLQNRLTVYVPVALCCIINIKIGASLYILLKGYAGFGYFVWFSPPSCLFCRKKHFLSDCVRIRIDQSGHTWPLENNARHWFINTSYVCIVLVQNPFPVWITFSIACGSYTGSDIVYTPGDEASLCSFLPANNSWWQWTISCS